MATVSACSKSVAELFDEGFVLFHGISKNYEATNSLLIQTKVKKCINLFEEATKLVSVAEMFSTNESIDEVNAAEVKFLLLPGLLGTLTLKLCVSDRLELINTAEIYFQDYLERCRCYGIIDFEVPTFVMPPTCNSITIDQNAPAPPSSLAAMACNRNQKIKRFLEEKNMLQKIDDLQPLMKNCEDDETIRSYYLLWIKYFASQALEELDCLYSEKGFLLTRPKEEEPENRRERKHRRSPLAPVIMAKKKQKYDDSAC